MTQKTHTLLLVDDEPNVTSGIQLRLRKSPYEVFAVESGADALRELSTRHVDVIVSDERMPGMSGSELLTEVRRTHPKVVRILLTGQASFEATVKAINDGGVFRVLTKPVAYDELLAAIAAGLEQTQTEQIAQQAVTSRDRAVTELELEHPGIGTVDRGDDGRIELQPLDPANDPDLARLLGG